MTTSSGKQTNDRETDLTGSSHCSQSARREPRYGKDHGEKITIGEICEELRKIDVPNDFRDKVDELFFDGAWIDDQSGRTICETFKRDVSGLLFAAMHPPQY